jgi:hypothetical protein
MPRIQKQPSNALTNRMAGRSSAALCLQVAAIERFQAMSTKSFEKTISLFYPTFLGYICGNQGTLQYNFENVRNWRSSGVDLWQLFEHDKLFFTGNPSASHWILIVVDFPKKKIQVYDSLNTSKEEFFSYCIPVSTGCPSSPFRI